MHLLNPIFRSSTFKILVIIFCVFTVYNLLNRGGLLVEESDVNNEDQMENVIELYLKKRLSARLSDVDASKSKDLMQALKNVIKGHLNDDSDGNQGRHFDNHDGNHGNKNHLEMDDLLKNVFDSSDSKRKESEQKKIEFRTSDSKNGNHISTKDAGSTEKSRSSLPNNNKSAKDPVSTETESNLNTPSNKPKKTTTEPPSTASLSTAQMSTQKGVKNGGVSFQLRSDFKNKEDLLKYMKETQQKAKDFVKPVYAKLNNLWNYDGGQKDYYGRIILPEPHAGLNECYDWSYNWADYTLIYKPTKKFQKNPCSYPKNEIVKKVIMPNKTVVWQGCTKDKLCSLLPYYNTERKERRNIPPCCRQKLLEMLRHIDVELVKRNITYTLSDGSVIGWYRNQKLVPYDSDIDMYVDGRIYRNQVWDEIFGNLTLKYGYVYNQTEDFKARLRYSKSNPLQLDIWPYFNIKLRQHYGEVVPGEWLTFVYHSGTTALRMREMLPPVRTTIEGVATFVPKDIINYLNKNYGPDPDNWLPELTCKKKKAYNCIS
ncbi:uncharacterized protein [Clytia hemisphaerica]|uniref:uncharacterized protein n=1 Tax=Clytia hemisphaerica TaxID=252671 RepID=UPI0034D61A8C